MPSAKSSSLFDEEIGQKTDSFSKVLQCFCDYETKAKIATESGIKLNQERQVLNKAAQSKSVKFLFSLLI